MIFWIVDPVTLASWREAAEYTSYLSELLLILLFGGFIAVESFAARVAATMANIGARNDEAWNRAVSEALADTTKLIAHSVKLGVQGRLSYRDCVDCLTTMSRLNLKVSNPLILARGIVRALACLPGGLYGALALCLVLIKTVADVAIILPPG